MWLMQEALRRENPRLYYMIQNLKFFQSLKIVEKVYGRPVHVRWLGDQMSSIGAAAYQAIMTKHRGAYNLKRPQYSIDQLPIWLKQREDKRAEAVAEGELLLSLHDVLNPFENEQTLVDPRRYIQ